MPTKQTKWNQKLRIAKRQGMKMIDGYWMILCAYCGNRFRMKHLTFDHVVRRRDGGRRTDDNLVLACQLCNQGREERFGQHFKTLIHHHNQTAK